MFLSIIVAVYNIDPYIEKCLDSLISCNAKDTELILVVGDSDDNSNHICMEYERKYKNITVLKQGGKGLSNARNCGMDIANGEYVMFVDGDDYILTDKFKSTLDKLKVLGKQSFDVFVSDFYMVDENDSIVSEMCQIEKSEKPICDYGQIKHFMKKNICFWNVWRYIYRRKFLNDNHIIFKENYLSEDIDYTTKIFIKTKNVVYYHNPYYCYRVGRKNSLMSTVNIKRISDTVSIIEMSVNTLLLNNDFQYAELMASKFIFEYILNMATIYEVSKTDRYRAKEIFHKTKNLLNADFYGFGRIMYIITSFLGIELVAYLLLCAKKMKRKVRKINLIDLKWRKEL